MPVRLGRFEMPKRLTKEDSTATDTYAKFIAEPFETGYGHTIGNSLRRVLLSSLEGAAITSIKIDGAMHEFATVDGVVEDVTALRDSGFGGGLFAAGGLVCLPGSSVRNVVPAGALHLAAERGLRRIVSSVAALYRRFRVW